MQLKEAVAIRVTEICDDLGSNICKISLGGGMSPSSIYDIVKGRTGDTKLATIARFCDGANISISEFFNSPLFDNLDLD